MLSFIVPAHNESFEIGRALASIFTSAKSLGQPFEVIVVNDASTDNTAELAHAAGARLLNVNLRKISAVRNAGAKAATGEVFFFVDADTQITSAVLSAAMEAIGEGAVGGGAWVEFSEPERRYVQLSLYFFNFLYMRCLRWAAGCFVYARRDAFEAVGGFDETLFASEEIFLSRSLKKKGRFAVLSESVTTSGRKLRMYSLWRIFPLMLGLFLHGREFLQQRRGLDWWYEGKREKLK